MAELTEDFPALSPGLTGIQGSSGDALPFLPEFAFNLSAEQSIDVGSGFEFYAAGVYSYIGEREGSFVSSAGTGDRLSLPSYDTLDLRTGLRNDDWTLNIYLRNVFDERGLVTITNQNGLATAIQASVNQPRTAGISLARRF